VNRDFPLSIKARTRVDEEKYFVIILDDKKIEIWPIRMYKIVIRCIINLYYFLFYYLFYFIIFYFILYLDIYYYFIFRYLFI